MFNRGSIQVRWRWIITIAAFGITRAQAEPDHAETEEEIAAAMRQVSLCRWDIHANGKYLEEYVHEDPETGAGKGYTSIQEAQR